MNPMFWFMFPFACVLIVPLIIGILRLIKWLRFRHDWMKAVRTQRTVWEQEEIELLRGLNEEMDREE
jgi:hypothetical protein